MVVANRPRILPMKTAGTEHLIERTYREGGAFQWVRETYKNSEEAGATRVEFGVEWQTVEAFGVYRRVIADNGKGMTAEELVEFFNTFGGGGKPIGGVHENFGVGAKTSLLPWNKYGMVVISWVDGEASMIWVQHDAESGEYGLKLEEVEDEETGESSLDEVCAPYDDPEHGCDWDSVKPNWITGHGTVIVLLGNEPMYDTVLGDPGRAEADIKGISAYLNRRLWEVPDSIQVVVDELRTQEKGNWPRSEDEGHGPASKTGFDRRTNARTILGARHYIEYPIPSFSRGRLANSGTVSISDGTDVDWFLWEKDRPAVQSYAAIGGYIAALYQNELYDITSHHATYRSFGVSEGAVRTKLWLILRPPLLGDEERHGVYPRGDRNALLLRGGPNAGGPLPVNDWAAEFADQLPEAILEAIKESRAGTTGTVDDETWREKLAERFGSRWRITKLRARKGGPLLVDPQQVGTAPSRRRKARKQRRRNGGGSGGGTGGKVNTGSNTGLVPAVKAKVAGGIPWYRLVRADAVGDGMLAAWAPNDPLHPEGSVLINVDHPVIQTQIEYWQSQFPDHWAEEIATDVANVYGELAVSRVAHSEHLRGILPSKTVEDDLRSEAALTMSLLGLLAEEAVLAPRIGGKYRRRRNEEQAS